MTPMSCTEESTFTRVSVLLACAVSAMLCEVVGSGVSARVRGGVADEEEVKGDLEFDVVLCQSELTDRALQLCLLLPPGFQPVSLHSYHTQPRATLCVLFNGCLMELNSHPSCSGPPISARELSKCVCARACVLGACVTASSIRQPPRAWNQSQSYSFFLHCPPFISTVPLSCLCSLQLYFSAWFSLNIWLRLSGRPFRGLRVWSLLHLSDTPRALCQLSFYISDLLGLLAALNSHH